jgi:hypothetical protein
MLGPSGIGKSSIVENMVKAMGWPVITAVGIRKKTYGPDKQKVFVEEVDAALDRRSHGVVLLFDEVPALSFPRSHTAKHLSITCILPPPPPTHTTTTTHPPHSTLWAQCNSHFQVVSLVL